MIANLNSQIRLLALELAESDPKTALGLRLDAGDLPKLLLDARKALRLTQAAVAAQLEVSEDTVKAWARGHEPQDENRKKVVEFLLKQSQTLSPYSTGR